MSKEINKNERFGLITKIIIAIVLILFLIMYSWRFVYTNSNKIINKKVTLSETNNNIKNDPNTTLDMHFVSLKSFRQNSTDQYFNKSPIIELIINNKKNFITTINQDENIEQDSIQLKQKSSWITTKSILTILSKKLIIYFNTKYNFSDTFNIVSLPKDYKYSAFKYILNKKFAKYNYLDTKGDSFKMNTDGTITASNFEYSNFEVILKNTNNNKKAMLIKLSNSKVMPVKEMYYKVIKNTGGLQFFDTTTINNSHILFEFKKIKE